MSARTPERPFQAYDGDDPYVFVCYSHDDKALVYPEITRLKDAGFNIWYDEGIAPGSEWSETLAQHIAGSSVFLYFVTPRSVDSQHCRGELNFALEEHCNILAVHLEPTEVPAGLRLSLNIRQAILRYEHPPDVYETKLSGAIRQTQADGVEAPSAPSTLQLGDWTLDVASQRLIRGDEEHQLDPKAQSVLLHLVDRAPDLVSREGLLARTWPGVVVGDNVLDQAITQLRKALGDDRRNPEYIETLPRRGYRLLAPVATPTLAAPVAAPPRRRRRAVVFASLTVIVLIGAVVLWRARDDAPEVPTTLPTIAVLTFADLSPNKEFGYLSEALSFDLNEHIRETGFDVLPRSLTVGRTASQLPDQVAYAIDGYLQRQEDGVAVGVQVVDLSSGRELLSETFVGTRDDPVALQQQIAARVSQYFYESVLGLTAPESYGQAPNNADAREAYLEYLKVTGDPDRKLAALERTLALDPTWALGHLHLAGEYGWRSRLPGGEALVAKAREALAEAQRLGLDESNPGVLMTQAELTMRIDQDYGAAEQFYRHAVLTSDEFNPYSGTYAVLMFVSGLAEEAEAVFDQVTEAFPTVPEFWSYLAQARGTNGRFEGAYQAALRYENLTAPNAFNAWHFPLYSLYTRTGRVEEAERRLAELRDLIAAGGGNSLTPIVERILTWELAFEVNDFQTALELAEEIAAKGDHIRAADWYLRLGDPRARDELLLVFQAGDPAYIGLGTMVLSPELREGPIFREALDSIGLTREWRLELCRRASTMPPYTRITCDPSKYALDVNLES